ncbi:MAG: hypothetical protein LIP04_11195 [Tannerellaceae bacterium]|nr:hypothetical protein [Tannerellaceae bacterium]
MCYNDDFTFMHKNPAILFTLPLAMILIVPFLNGIAKKKKDTLKKTKEIYPTMLPVDSRRDAGL